MLLRALLFAFLALSSSGHAYATRRVEARVFLPRHPCAQADERESLEELLKRLKAKREQLLADWQERLTPLLEELKEEIEGKSSKRVALVRDRIAEFGFEIAPLLVPALDPGVVAARPAKEYSRQLARILMLIPTTSITDELLALCDAGSLAGKQNALRVLAVSPEPERVSKRLIELYRKSAGETRAALLNTIAQLGSEEGDLILHGVLQGSDEVLRGIALDAVVSAGASQFVDDMLALLLNLEISASFAYKFVPYLKKCPDVVSKEYVAGLLSAALDQRVSGDQRIAILAALPAWERLIDSRMKRSLKNLKTPSNRGIEQQALVLLSVMGDANARKKLLKPFDEKIDESGDRWPVPYIDRGVILYQINDFTRALRDFKQARKLSKDNPRSAPLAYEYAARCHARLGNLKKAAAMLETAPIDLAQLRALASEPVFRELRDSRYGKVFRLEK